MSEIPDTWPPPLSSSPLPMFPLPGVFLYPGQPLPLHIFEPRYRQMIEDSLDGPGRIVLSTIQVGEEETDDHVPAVLPIGGLGEIARHDRMDDGRFLIVLFGIGRVELDEVESDEPYRKVRIAHAAQISPELEVAKRLDGRLRGALRERMGADLTLPKEVPIEALIDLLCTRLKPEPGVMERIFAERDVTRRGELALASHAELA